MAEYSGTSPSSTPTNFGTDLNILGHTPSPFDPYCPVPPDEDAQTPGYYPGEDHDSQPLYILPFESRATVQKGAKYRIRRILDKLWLWEVLGCIVAWGSLLVILALLRIYRNKLKSSWIFPFSINSVISLLTTVMKAAMMIPVASGLGQLKWIWFKKRRVLRDFERYDDASRGVLGALKLLISLRLKHLASIGALAAIAAIFIGPFTQNTVQIDVELIPFKDGAIYHTYTLNTGNIQDGDYPYSAVAISNIYDSISPINEERYPSIQMMDSISWGWSYNSGDLGTTGPPVNCRSGNCTYENYQTLAICCSCSDITGMITRQNKVSALPNELQLREEVDAIVINCTTKYPMAEDLQDVSPLIVTISAIAWDVSVAKPFGSECVLFWCVVESSGQYSNTNTYSRLMETNERNTYLTPPAKTNFQQESNITMVPDRCWINGTSIDPTSNSNCTFVVTSSAQYSLQMYLSRFLTGYAQYPTETAEWKFTSQNILAITSVYRTRITQGYSFHSVVMESVNNLAFAMSTTVRLNTAPNDGPYPYNIAYGTEWISLPLIRVQWLWMIGPASILFLTTLFLLGIIVKSRTTEPWKSSALPPVFHGLELQVASQLPSALKLADMRDIADRTQVKARITSEGLRLVL